MKYFEGNMFVADMESIHTKVVFPKKPNIRVNMIRMRGVAKTKLTTDRKDSLHLRVWCQNSTKGDIMVSNQ